MYLCHDRLVSRRERSAAIVAGGQARRLSGLDKSRLVVDGRPIIVRQVEVLQSVAALTFVVGGVPGRYADLGLPVHEDLMPGTGALGGIYTAVVSATTPFVLTVACDMPFLHPGVLAELGSLAESHDAAWVATARGVEPLLACYRTTIAPVLAARLANGQLRASDIANDLDIAVMGPDRLAAFGPPDRLLANVNTPEDYARVQYGLS